jgi:hypothetical protein
MVATMTVTLGELTLTDDPVGDPSWKVQELDGWWSPPPVETNIENIPLGDGGFDAPTFRRPKTFSINGVVQASTRAAARTAAWDRLAGLSPTGGPMTLTVMDEAGTRQMQVRLASNPQVLPYGGQRAFFQIPLVAADGRKYGPLISQQRGIGLPAATDGLTFPLFSDGTLSFGSFTGTNSVALANTGTAPTFPTFAVSGYFDSAGFVIVSDAGEVITFQRTVSPGSTVILSPYAGGRATIDGSDQTTYLTSPSWTPIPPKGSRAYTLFAAGQSDAGAGMTVTYREAWW